MKRRLRQEVTDLNSELKDLAQERDRFAEQLKQANDLSDDLRTKVESLQMEMSASRLDPEAKGTSRAHFRFWFQFTILILSQFQS